MGVTSRVARESRRSTQNRRGRWGHRLWHP